MHKHATGTALLRFDLDGEHTQDTVKVTQSQLLIKRSVRGLHFKCRHAMFATLSPCTNYCTSARFLGGGILHR